MEDAEKFTSSGSAEDAHQPTCSGSTENAHQPTSSGSAEDAQQPTCSGSNGTKQSQTSEVAQNPIVESQEYETQFFGFPPKSFANGVYNAVLGYVHDAYKASHQYLQEEFPDLVTADHEELAKEQIVKKIKKVADSSFDRLELYLNENIFTIPSNVLLPEDEIHRKHQYTVEQETQLDEEIKLLQQKIKKTKYMNGRLKQEMADLDKMNDQCENVIKHLKSLEKVAGTGVTGTKDSMMYLMYNALKVKDLFNNMPDTTIPNKKTKSTDVPHSHTSLEGFANCSSSDETSVKEGGSMQE